VTANLEGSVEWAVPESSDDQEEDMLDDALGTVSDAVRHTAAREFPLFLPAVFASSGQLALTDVFLGVYEAEP
jgi:hypothetical protein